MQGVKCTSPHFPRMPLQLLFEKQLSSPALQQTAVTFVPPSRRDAGRHERRSARRSLQPSLLFHFPSGRGLTAQRRRVWPFEHPPCAAGHREARLAAELAVASRRIGRGHGRLMRVLRVHDARPLQLQGTLVSSVDIATAWRCARANTAPTPEDQGTPTPPASDQHDPPGSDPNLQRDGPTPQPACRGPRSIPQVEPGLHGRTRTHPTTNESQPQSCRPLAATLTKDLESHHIPRPPRPQPPNQSAALSSRPVIRWHRIRGRRLCCVRGSLCV